jgi:hypothetical protein
MASVYCSNKLQKAFVSILIFSYFPDTSIMFPDTISLAKYILENRSVAKGNLAVLPE